VVRVGRGSPEVGLVTLPLRVHFLRDAAEKLLLRVQRKRVLYRRCFLGKFLVRS
jgi:hypothetical protein